MELRGSARGPGSSDFDLAYYRLVKDFSAPGVRLQAGTLTYPTIGAQRSPMVIGVGVERRFEIDGDDLAQTEPVAFFLDEGSEVSLFLNGRRIHEEKFSAGPHLIEGIPLVPGRNELAIRANGEEQAFTLPYARQLLPAGTFDYTATLGVLGEPEAPEPGPPATSSFLRYGITTRWTAGSYTYLDEASQMIGMETSWAIPWGTLSARVSGSRSDTSDLTEREFSYGGEGRVAYQFIDPRGPLPTLRFSLGVGSPYFSAAGKLASRDTEPIRGEGTVSIPLTDRLNTGFGVRGVSDAGLGLSRLEATLTVSFEPSERSSLRFAIRSESLASSDPRISGVILLRLRPEGRNYTLQQTQSTDNLRNELAAYGRGSGALEGLNWRGATALRGAERPQFESRGSVTYRGRRGTAGLRGEAAFDEAGDLDAYRFGGSVGSSLLFAGESVAVGPNSSGSFVIIERHPSLGETVVGIRRGEQWSSRTDLLGPAVETGYTAHRRARINLAVEEVPRNVGLGRMNHLIRPGYRSGYRFTVGTGPTVSVTGTLVAADGEPVTLLGGYMTPLDPERERIRFFTDEQGVFRVYGLAPGKWRAEIPRGNRSAAFVIPDGSRPDVDLGTLTLEREKWTISYP